MFGPSYDLMKRIRRKQLQVKNKRRKETQVSGRSLYLGVDDADGGLGTHVSLEAFDGSGVEAKNCIMGI